MSASGGLVRNSAQPIRWTRGMLKFPISSHHHCRAATRMTLTRHGVRGRSIFGDFVERRTAEALPWEELCVCAASPRQYISIVPTTTDLAATHAGQCAAVSRGVPQHCSRRNPQHPWLAFPGQAASRMAGSRPVLCRRRKRAIPLQRQNAAWFMRQQRARHLSLPGSCCRAAASHCGGQRRVPVSACLTDMSST